MDLPEINTEKLFAIAWRIVSADTVQETKDFVALINQAAQLVIKSAKRIAGLESRNIRDADFPLIDQIIKEYRA